VARRYLWLVIAVVIGIAAMSAVGDVRHLGDALAGFEWWALAVALALALGNYVLRFVRWQLYLARREVRVPVTSSALVFGAGLSLSITPGKLGELVKAYLLREMHDVPATQTAPIVVAERVTDLIALVVVGLVGVARYGLAPTFVAVAAALVAVGLVLLAWTRPTLALVDFITRPDKLRRLREPLRETLAHLAELCRPGTLIAATAIAIPAWGCECLGFGIICNAFPGAHVDYGLAAVIYAGTTIAGALSFLPGGLGVTEGAMTIALVEYMSRASASAATLLTRLATLWFAVALGIVFLALARQRIRTLAASR
jgi:uncharacterized protein (TIRG00374 family)